MGKRKKNPIQIRLGSTPSREDILTQLRSRARGAGVDVKTVRSYADEII